MSTSESESEVFEQMETPPKRSSNNGKFVYLVTYSQADLIKCPSRERFAEIVSSEFNAVKEDDVVEEWACAIENHKRHGVHYHLSIKLQQRRRFKQVRNNIKLKFDIDLDFKEWTTFYYDCFTYVKKQDKFYITSPNHTPLDNSPVTKGAVAAKRTSNSHDIAVPGPSSKRSKPSRMDLEHFYKIVIANNIRNDLGLCVLAKRQLAEGKSDLHKFILSKPERQRVEIIKTAWKIEESVAKLDRKKQSRLEILRQAKLGEHKAGCTGEWVGAAHQVLDLNNIYVGKFAEDVRNLLENGRGKGRNIMITGESNCAKSFILMPLTEIYNTFMCPSSNKFNWVGANEKEVVLLNDLNYSEEGVMKWMTFLNLLEGAPVHISVPKNHFAEDVLWTELTPIFATCLAPIVRIIGGSIHRQQTKMMDNRWKFYEFKHVFDEEDTVTYPNCGKCFAEFILDN